MLIPYSPKIAVFVEKISQMYFRNFNDAPNFNFLKLLQFDMLFAEEQEGVEQINISCHCIFSAYLFCINFTTRHLMHGIDQLLPATAAVYHILHLIGLQVRIVQKSVRRYN